MKRSRKQLKSDLSKSIKDRIENYHKNGPTQSKPHPTFDKNLFKLGDRKGKRLFVYNAGVNQVRKILKGYKGGGIKYIHLADLNKVAILHTCTQNGLDYLIEFLNSMGLKTSR